MGTRLHVMLEYISNWKEFFAKILISLGINQRATVQHTDSIIGPLFQLLLSRQSSLNDLARGHCFSKLEMSTIVNYAGLSGPREMYGTEV